MSHTKPKQIKPTTDFSYLNLLYLAIVFGTIGAYLIIHSFAASNPNLPGDLNNDNTVNITDLALVLNNYNTTNSFGDVDGNGTVNITDLSILLTHYGQTLASNTIPSNIASDCSVDVTSAINSWMSSVANNTTLNFGTNKCYRIEGVLLLQNRSGLTLQGNGSTFQSFNTPADQRPIWQIWDSGNIKLDNMSIIGSYATPGTFTANLQHAHGVDLRGSSVEIANTTIKNVAGDCVYFGLGSDNNTRASGNYHDSTCNGTGRNGVSLVAADNVLVQRVSTDNVGYETFDVEPNVGAGFGDCHDTFDSNTINNFAQHAFSIVESAPVCYQSFTNNHIIGPKGFKIAIGDPLAAGFRTSHVTITGNTADNAASPTPINADHIDYFTVTGNTAPMIGGGYFAAVDGGCQVNVSGNTIPGGGDQLYTVNPVTGC